MRRFTGYLVVFMLVLAACGTSEPAAVDSAQDATTSTAVVTTTTTTTTVPESQLETLADFFGYGGTPEEEQAKYAAQEVEIQESIRSCMAEQGFDYIPVIYPNDFVDFEFDEREFAETQGFGISTWYLLEEEFLGEEDFFEDPNQAAIEAMSDSERDAYYEALWGDQEEFEPTYDEEGNEVYENFGFGSGCDGQAYEKIYGGQDDLYMEFGPELEELYSKTESDPRIVELQAEWASCMGDAGYAFDDQEDMYNWLFEDFQMRVDEVLGQVYFDPFVGWTDEEINNFFETKTEEEIEAFFQEGEQQDRAEVDEEALAVLNAEEIEIALVNFDCSQDFQEIWQEVSEEYEAEFVRQNRTRLEELQDAREDG